jgi:hypothetical protein
VTFIVSYELVCDGPDGRDGKCGERAYKPTGEPFTQFDSKADALAAAAQNRYGADWWTNEKYKNAPTWIVEPDGRALCSKCQLIAACEASGGHEWLSMNHKVRALYPIYGRPCAKCPACMEPEPFIQEAVK